MLYRLQMFSDGFKAVPYIGPWSRPKDQEQTVPEETQDMAERKRWHMITISKDDETLYCKHCFQAGDSAHMEWGKDPEEAFLFTTGKQAWWMWFACRNAAEEKYEGWKPDVIMKNAGDDSDINAAPFIRKEN